MKEVKMMMDHKEEKESEYEEWELECKARTLMEAEEIKADPKLLAAIQPYLNKKISSLKALRKIAAKKITAEAKRELG